MTEKYILIIETMLNEMEQHKSKDIQKKSQQKKIIKTVNFQIKKTQRTLCTKKKLMISPRIFMYKF